MLREDHRKRTAQRSQRRGKVPADSYGCQEARKDIKTKIRGGEHRGERSLGVGGRELEMKWQHPADLLPPVLSVSWALGSGPFWMEQ